MSAEPQPRILAFAGSARRESLNRKLIRIAAAGAESSGADCTLIELHDFPLPIYDGDLEAEQGLPGNAERLRELFASHSGLLISSPENNSSISALLKNTIDWVTRSPEATPDLSCFQGKIVGLLAASPGPLGGLRGLATLRSLLSNIGCVVLPDQVTIRQATDAFDSEGQLINRSHQSRAEGLGATVCEWVARWKGQGR